MERNSRRLQRKTYSHEEEAVAEAAHDEEEEEEEEYSPPTSRVVWSKNYVTVT